MFGRNGSPEVTADNVRKSLDAMTNNQVAEIYNSLQLRREWVIQQYLDHRKDIDAECGYPHTTELTPELYHRLYERQPIAARVVDIFPEECWQVLPELYEVEDENETPFEIAFKELGNKLSGTSLWQDEENNPIWRYLYRLDKLCGVGRYGCLMLGVDDGEALDQELFPAAGLELRYLRVFDESNCEIVATEQDEQSERYSLPTMYSVNLLIPTATAQHNIRTQNVHWTRIIHVADNLLTDETMGVSRIQRAYDRLYDLHKLYSGSAEMYWQGALPMISFETHPQLGGQVNLDAKAMRDALEQMFTGLQRWAALPGMSANQLAPTVVDPTPQIEKAIEALCIFIGVPKRVFVGSERGELASSQDMRTWYGRCKHRQNTFIIPSIIVPFINRLVQLEILPEPKQFSVNWPDIATVTDQEEAQVGLTITQMLAAYAQSDIASIITPRDYLVRICKFDSAETDEMLDNAAKLMEENAEAMALEQEQEQPQFDEEGNPLPPQPPKPFGGMKALDAKGATGTGGENAGGESTDTGTGVGKPSSVASSDKESEQEEEEEEVTGGSPKGTELDKEEQELRELLKDVKLDKEDEEALKKLGITNVRTVLNEGRWITIGGDDGDGGTPVFIDKSGSISKGPKGLVGKKLGKDKSEDKKETKSSPGEEKKAKELKAATKPKDVGPAPKLPANARKGKEGTPPAKYASARADHIDKAAKELYNSGNYEEAKKAYRLSAMAHFVASKLAKDPGELNRHTHAFRDSLRRFSEDFRSSVGVGTPKSLKDFNPKVVKNVSWSTGETARSLSSTQFNIPVTSELHAKLLNMANGMAAYLVKDGIENEPHITVKFGLMTDNYNMVASIVQSQKPVTVTLGKTKVFEQEHCDVVYVDISSAGLRRLNKLIEKQLPCAPSEHLSYKPHLTLARVAVGIGYSFAGRNDVAGTKVTFDRLMLCGADGRKRLIELNGDVANSDCGAGSPGGKGFQKGNTCGASDGTDKKSASYQQTMSGEYWLDGGTATYADGDIGDMNHEGYVIDQAQRLVIDSFPEAPEFDSNSPDWDSFEAWLEETYGEDETELIAALKKADVSEDLFDVARGIGHIDPRAYAAEHWGWVRVAGNDIQLDTLNKEKLKDLANGLSDAYSDVEESDFISQSYNIETKTAYYTDVPYPVLEEGDMKTLRDYKQHGTPGWGGVSNKRKSVFASVANADGVWRTIRGSRVFIEDGKITKGPKDLIGKSNEEGKSVPKRTRGKERVEFGNRLLTISRNPTKASITAALKRGDKFAKSSSEEVGLRAVLDKTSGDVFMWDPEQAYHSQVVSALKLQDPINLKWGIGTTSDTVILDIDKERTKLGVNNQADEPGVWRTIRGARVFIEGGVITKGPEALIGTKQDDSEQGNDKESDVIREIKERAAAIQFDLGFVATEDETDVENLPLSEIKEEMTSEEMEEMEENLNEEIQIQVDRIMDDWEWEGADRNEIIEQLAEEQGIEIDEVTEEDVDERMNELEKRDRDEMLDNIMEEQIDESGMRIEYIRDWARQNSERFERSAMADAPENTWVSGTASKSGRTKYAPKIYHK